MSTATALQPYKILRGDWAKAQYQVLRLVRNNCPNIWHGQRCDPPQQDVILKTARADLLENETAALKGYLRGHPSFRQLVDEIKDQTIGVFEFLSHDIQDVVHMQSEKKLKEREVKKVTEVLLKGLVAMHDRNIAHTDIKPNNVLVNINPDNTLDTIKLIDLGDAVAVKSDTNFPISGPSYRAPEAMFEQSWSVAVDLWSLGATVMYLLFGAHMFDPPGVEKDDLTYPLEVLIRQCAFFGPFPDKFAEVVNSDTMASVQYIEQTIVARGGRAPYKRSLDTNFSKKALSFINKCMKLDPRDRVSAQELLNDGWLSGVPG
ncbi:hypothetical protein MMC30_005911 [Trapelia coarctata]|nr:hypothetical protein [Trapelia coarctata]